MANYLLSHTGAQIDEGIEKAFNIENSIAERIGTAGPAAGRNLADNADFQIWTRGESVTVADGSGQTCADRHSIGNYNGVGATATMAKDIMVVDGVSRTCGKVSLSAVVSSYASGKGIIPFIQGFEGCSIYRYLSSGKSFTVAIAVEVSVAGKYAFGVWNADTSYSYIHTAILAANTPTVVQFTVTIPTSGGIWNCPNTIAKGLDLLIGAVGNNQFAAPSIDEWVSGSYYTAADCVNWTATAGATIKVTRVRLEEGSVLGAYQAKSYEEDEARCQYFLPSIPVGVIGMCSWKSDTTGFMSIPFKIPTRIVPTGITVPSGVALNSTIFTINTLIFNLTTSQQIGCVQVSGSGASSGLSSLVYTSGSGRVIFTGAEL